MGRSSFEAGKRGVPMGRLLVLFGVIAIMVVLYLGGVHEQLDPRVLRETVRGAGPWGVLLFLLAYGLLQPLHVSAHLFIVTATLVWSPWVAGGISFTGSMVSSAVAFYFARQLGREWIQPRLPERIRRLDDALSTGGLRAVFLMKLLFFTTPAVQFAFGVSRVRTSTFFLGTALGNLPTVVAVTLFGVWLDELLKTHPPSTWEIPWVVPVVAVVVIVALFVYLRWRFFRGDGARSEAT